MSSISRPTCVGILLFFCLSLAPGPARADHMLEYLRDSPSLLDDVRIIVQEAPVAETGNPEGNLAGARLTQQEAARLAFPELLLHGKRIYTTPFTPADGFGDGPLDESEDYRLPGGRVGLQKAAPVVRVNGLDGQTCLECHNVARNSVIPALPGIGGVAGIAAQVLFQPSAIDVSGVQPSALNGRFINPLLNAGLGGIELAAKEMTAELQAIKARARAAPGRYFLLKSKGTSYGSIRYDPVSGRYDTGGVQGVDADLVVRPFGRKGEFATVRNFDILALSFHFGMQATEAFGDNTDADGDGVADEILPGDLTALSIFLTNLPRPFVHAQNPARAQAGYDLFLRIGCAGCHRPVTLTSSRFLTYSFPVVPEDPDANIFFAADLTRTAGFTPTRRGGIAVPMFSDLKRHNMGENLSESFDLADARFNREFITARLWGVRDTAPYMHDGRALTIVDAIMAHDGEALSALRNFQNLTYDQQEDLLELLNSLRTPVIR